MTAPEPFLARTFDPSVKAELSRLLQHTKAFRLNSQMRARFNLACVVQDRILDAMSYLDKHREAPSTDSQFYLMMVYADNLFSAVHEVFKAFDEVQYPYGEGCAREIKSKFFFSAFHKALPELPDDEVPSDDQFFRYFRSLTFAHPYETSRQKFIAKDEIHYSPFVLNNSNHGLPDAMPDAIGVKVYSSKRSPNEFSIILSYRAFKDFLISRYDTLQVITKYIQAVLDDQQSEWLKHKADRNLSPIELAEELRGIYKERHEDTYFIDEAIQHLTTELSPGFGPNEQNVAKFRAAIEAVLVPVCDALEKPDYNEAADKLDAVLSPDIPDWPENPDNEYRGMEYHRGKVAEYCGSSECSRTDYVAIDLKCLMKGFVKKWVTIDPKIMSRQEIWLLVSTAWYLESKECVERGIVRAPVQWRVNLSVKREESV